ncbi:MAG: hypothetical protein AAF907_16965, partial [Planctomycetota bacterium]
MAVSTAFLPGSSVFDASSGRLTARTLRRTTTCFALCLIVPLLAPPAVAQHGPMIPADAASPDAAKSGSKCPIMGAMAA